MWFVFAQSNAECYQRCLPWRSPVWEGVHGHERLPADVEAPLRATRVVQQSHSAVSAIG